MVKSRLFFFILITGLLAGIANPLPAQFVTIARKIKKMRNDDNDAATVILDAGASRVYRAMIDTLSAQPKCRITKKDPGKMHVQFTTAASSLSMQVDSLAQGLSQITVVAVPTANSSQKTSDAAVNAILGVCHKVGIKCSVKNE